MIVHSLFGMATAWVVTIVFTVLFLGALLLVVCLCVSAADGDRKMARARARVEADGRVTVVLGRLGDDADELWSEAA